MTSSKWLILAATLAIVPYAANAQTRSSEKDAACAQIGIDRIAKGLGG